ncbi:MAG: hypothetical protein A2481_01425 [Candidatus Yonathbacteria bacterium RIFOXYC2_FULL_47_9]|nr:MAG: hypothetical protein A2481_01425 [Candidatus Yonathbacteria bacterium RIFOXYC2_FULL_47_9]HAT68472.1 hypothetical protein [Candidatus Yonathbacteria bacterium]
MGTVVAFDKSSIAKSPTRRFVMNKKFLAKKVWIRITNPFRPTLKGAICGHKTKRAGEITVHDKSCVMEMPVNDDGHPDYCLSCIADMAIRCAWCGGTILIGKSVTLNIPSESFEIPEYAVRYKEDEQALVGCTRWDCSIGIDVCGRWMPPGVVERFPSPIELALQSEEMLIISDLTAYPDGVPSIPKYI